jgi:peroxiredoxin
MPCGTTLGNCANIVEAQDRGCRVSDYQTLPAGLPAPVDDGAAAHLPGRAMPSLSLPSTDGREITLSELGPGRTVLYVYPRTGQPGAALPDGWDEIPGARGCTPEACGFRDHHAELLAAGAGAVYGLSSQDTGYQREVVERLHLPFPLISDEQLRLAGELELPTFTIGGMTLYRRLTMVVTDGRIEHVFYPIFPPDEHAQQVVDWLRQSS